MPTVRPTATPAPTAAPANIATKHVLTAAYVGVSGGTDLAPHLLAPWLSWAETSWQLNGPVVGAGIKAMYYTNPNRAQPADQMYSSTESSFAHACDGSRIKSNYIPNQYLMQPSSAVTHNSWASVVARVTPGAHWDAIFEDDTNDVLYTTAQPCNYSAAAWLADSKAEQASLNAPIIYNGLQIANQMTLNQNANVIGGMREGCYADSSGFPKIWDSFWVDIENNELAMASQHKLFLCLGRDFTQGDVSIDGRTYAYASFLLSYSLTSSVLWENYYTISHFQVEPETRLVALNPVVPSPVSISSLQLVGGTYGREYNNCYIGGVPVGRCASIVNPDRYNSHPYPYGTKYRHSMLLSGGGVWDGGTISTTGPAPATSLPPLEAVIAFE
ncbi:MAG: hypothetical protein GIX00_07480 [Candidatus Eremiobacteraeota bacterium]|nr:hypothetical protein [Candidatus Eremiobacteraeota bacterium]